MSTQPTGPTDADRSAGDAAALVPTATPTTQPADHVPADRVPADRVPADHVTADHVTADHVTAREIAEFLHHLARFRSPVAGGDPADHAALFARKAELFARIADQHALAATGPPSTAAPTTPNAPEGHAS
jgi:hypothetical protein